jgi:CheY-like chemotaxis protein
VLDRMFDPFYTTKGVGEGTGLGLSLVHGIVADLGGGIDVSTSALQGTTFTVWLPMAGVAPARAAERVDVLPRGNGETVMVVDDERPLVELTEEMLAELGYEPIGFHSSSDALAAFRADPGRFDLVLTDEAMPDTTGTALAEALRRLRVDVPIVLMSGYSEPGVLTRARWAGIADVLRKPLGQRDIADAVARALATRPTQRRKRA